MKTLFFITLFTIFFLLSFVFLPGDKTPFPKVLTNDDYNFIDANRIKMWVSNNGLGSHNPETDDAGLFWQEGSAVDIDGLILTCKIGYEYYAIGNTVREGLQAGKILPDGSADNPDAPQYRVYKIYKYWRELQPGPLRDSYQRDYNEWPVADGAPWTDVNNNSVFEPGIDTPEFLGDQMLWFVSNDLDERRTTFSFGCPPIGLEIQTTVYAFYDPGILGDIVFKNYRIINKSKSRLDESYISYWSNCNLGYVNNDFGGCDTLLDLSYVWNYNDEDEGYHAPVPAVGYTLLDGLEKNMTAFYSMYYGNMPDHYFNSRMLSQIYFFISKGLRWDGRDFINPLTGQATTFMVPGDPVSQTGWYEGEGWPDGPTPSDRRIMQSSGPYRIFPGDTIDVTYAVSVRRGKDNIDSITELRRAAKVAHTFYNSNFKNTVPPPAPVLKAYPSDRRINLYWQNNAESFIAADLIEEDQNYVFEGYKIWQYSSADGDDPQLLAIFDKKNDLKTLNDYQRINGIFNDVTALSLPNEGLQRTFTITQDIIRKERLRNGSPYYFAVTAFAYSDSSFPRILESTAQIITIIPGDERIDKNYSHLQDEKLSGRQIAGDGHGKFYVEIIDPDALTGHSYHAVIDTFDSLSWTIVDSTIDDTLLKNVTNFSADLSQGYVFYGLRFVMQNEGRDSLQAIYSKNYGVKSVVQVTDGSVVLDSVYDLINGTSADGYFSVTSYGPESIRDNINASTSDAIGYDNYEIRFTTQDEGSEYYLYGYLGSFRGPVTNDPKAENKVPFQIWNVGRDLDSDKDDTRLKVKIRDNFQHWGEDDKFISDSVWSRAANGNWEAIYGFLEKDSSYHSGLDSFSHRGYPEDYYIHSFVIKGELPQPGTVIRIIPWRPLQAGNVFSIRVNPPVENDYQQAKNRLSDISVFPNPYFGSDLRDGRPGQGFVRLTNLPQKVTIRVYTVAGELVIKESKNDPSPWWDWNLRNQGGMPVASGIFILHLDMPEIGQKILKAAIVQDNYTILDN